MATPVFLPGKSHGQSKLEDYRSWDHKRVRHNLVIKQRHICVCVCVWPCACSCMYWYHKWNMSEGRAQTSSSRTQLSVSGNWLPVSGPVSLPCDEGTGYAFLQVVLCCTWHPWAFVLVLWPQAHGILGLAPMSVSDAVFSLSFGSSISWQLGKCCIDNLLYLLPRSILGVLFSFHHQLSHLEESPWYSGSHPEVSASLLTILQYISVNIL